jgi:hypothetical protein
MAPKVPPEDDDQSRKVAWINTIQTIIWGAVEIILTLINRGRLPL